MVTTYPRLWHTIPMTNEENSIYQIRIEGEMDAQWSDWFSGLTISALPDDETLLSGPVADQVALRGILERIWDLNLVLISVIRKG